MIGTPKSEEDIAFIKSEEARLYLKCFREQKPIDLSEMYPAVDKRGLQLLERMLKFNPETRVSAREALADPYFDEIRLEEQENFERADIDLSFIDRFQEGEIPRDELHEIVREKIE